MKPDSNPLGLGRRTSAILAQTGNGLLAMLALALIVIEVWVIGGDGLETGGRIIATILAPAIALPIAVRSNVPLPALAVNSAATTGMIMLGHDSEFYQWPNLLLLFTVAAVGSKRDSWLGLLIALSGVAYYFVTFRFEGVTTGIAIFAVWVVVWLIGRGQGSKIEANRLRSDRDLAAELAAARQVRLELEAQRTTMARELHDLIGHTVNVMVVHAGAGRRAVRSDPDGAERALTTIETTGRSALEELDRVLGLLRSDDTETALAPLPGLTAVAGLVEDFNQTGLSVTLVVHGAIDDVPEGLGLTAYRVVQEGLTNTIKHSAATSAEVEIRVGPSQVDVSITDPGPPRSDPAGGERERRGLAGIVERVQLQGGQVRFGPIDGTGYRITCVLPVVRSDVTR